MRRREFIAGLGGVAVWPLLARAQQPDWMRRIGVLMGWDESDAEAKSWFSGFTQGFAELGWADGRNVRIDLRWAAGNVDRMHMLAKELIGLQSEVMLASGTAVTTALQHETQTIPIVFTLVGDPVGDGLVAGLPRPGGNITGFTSQEAEMGGKWLELLTEIAPGVKRAAIMFNPDTAPRGRSYYRSFGGRRPITQSRADRWPRTRRRGHRDGHDFAGARAGRRPRRHAGKFYQCSSRANYFAGRPK
jgi:putative tryptophan/tyrosine transport system substrate-binding protein